MRKFTLALALLLALMSNNTFAGEMISPGFTGTTSQSETNREGEMISPGRNCEPDQNCLPNTQSSQTDADDEDWYGDLLDYFGELLGSGN